MQMPEHLLPRLLEVLQKGTYVHTHGSGGIEDGARVSSARLLLTAQRQVQQLEALTTVIKARLPPAQASQNCTLSFRK